MGKTRKVPERVWVRTADLNFDYLVDHGHKHRRKPSTKPMSQAAARLGQAIEEQSSYE